MGTGHPRAPLSPQIKAKAPDLPSGAWSRTHGLSTWMDAGPPWRLQVPEEHRPRKSCGAGPGQNWKLGMAEAGPTPGAPLEGAACHTPFP